MSVNKWTLLAEDFILVLLELLHVALSYNYGDKEWFLFLFLFFLLSIWVPTWLIYTHSFSIQGMACRPNTHRPSFHVNMVGLEKSTQRSNSSRYPWDLDAEMMDEEEEFDIWLQQALASGLFCETSKRRKSWSPFKLPQKKGKKQWQRSPWIALGQL